MKRKGEKEGKEKKQKGRVRKGEKKREYS